MRLQRCDACGHHQLPERGFCVRCRASALSMVDACGRGVLHSFTRVLRSPREDLEPGYVVALVDLEEGVRVLTWYVGEPEPVCDMPVRLTHTGDLPTFTDVGLRS